jgi:hypothetical protein
MKMQCLYHELTLIRSRLHVHNYDLRHFQTCDFGMFFSTALICIEREVLKSKGSSLEEKMFIDFNLHAG